MFPPPCGFDLARTRTETAALGSRSRWKSPRAIKSERVHLTDGNRYFNRPRPRPVESREFSPRSSVQTYFVSDTTGPVWKNCETSLLTGRVGSG